MGEPTIMIILASLVVLACLAFLTWVLLIRPGHLTKLHDEVVDGTTSAVLEACLSYGQSQLSASEYERFKTLLTAEITEGAGGISLAALVERCIAEAREESNAA
jgi:hypothetical protein